MDRDRNFFYKQILASDTLYITRGVGGGKLWPRAIVRYRYRTNMQPQID